MSIQKFWVRISFLNYRFSPFVGRPNGLVKTNFAHKMAKIMGCEFVYMENYYKAKEVKDSYYDEFNVTLDLLILLKVCVHFQLLSLHI